MHKKSNKGVKVLDFQGLKYIHKPLLILSLILFAVGLVMIQSASSLEAYLANGLSPYHYFFRQGGAIIIGLLAGGCVLIFPTKYYGSLVKIALIAIIALLGFIPLIGIVSNNARSWIELGLYNLQPSELAKIILIIYMATYYAKNIKELDDKGKLLWPLSIMVILFSEVAVLQPDLGTALIIVGIGIAIFYSLPIDAKLMTNINKIIISGLLLIGVLFMFRGELPITEVQKKRLDFLNPCTRYEDVTGYQVCNGFIAINNGGLIGKGIGRSTQKYLYLPFCYTDFIFAIIVEELGLIGGVIGISLIFILLAMIYNIGKKAVNLQSSLICYGVAAYIFIHLVVNLGGVLGLLPLTGVPFPFMSYGGSYALSLLISLAIVQRIYIESKEAKVKVVKKINK